MTVCLLAGLAACGGGGDPVVPPPAVATVSVTPAIREVRVGESIVLQVEVKDAAGNVLTGRVVTWTSSANATATVNAAGQVTAVGPGQAVITATSETRTGGATINVPLPVADIVMDAPEFVQIGQTVLLGARAVSSTGATLGRPITYSTSNLAVLAVSGSGQVTGLAAGTATVTASSEGKSKEVTMTATPVASASLDYPSSFFPTNHNVQLSVAGRDAGNAIVTGTKQVWTSSVPAFTISQSGLFRANDFAAGVITATLDGKSASREFFTFPELKNSEPQGPIGAPTTEDRYRYGWVLIMPPPPSRLVLSISGPNGDADLYLFRPSKTDEIAEECVPFLDGSNEVCDLENLPAGYWFVVINPFSAYSGLTLQAVITTPGAAVAKGQTIRKEAVLISVPSVLKSTTAPAGRTTPGRRK